MKRFKNSLAIACLSLNISCADRWLIYPSTQPIDPHGAIALTLVNHDRKIEIYTARSPAALTTEPQAFSLDFCGNAGRAEQIATRRANQWSPHAVEVWIPNYPGFGKSDGPASLQNFPEAALATFDALKKRAGNRPIFVNGYSLGTTLALYVAAHRSVAGLMLQSPPPLQREILWHYGWWNLWMVASITAMEIPCEMNSLINAPHANANAVFILTVADTLIPIDYQMMIVHAYHGKKHLVLLEHADHTTPISHQDQPRITAGQEWLWNQAMGI